MMKGDNDWIWMVLSAEIIPRHQRSYERKWPMMALATSSR